MRISDWSSDVCSSDLPDREQPHPIAPDPPDDLFRHVTPRSVRVLPGTEQQFGAIDVADAAHHRLIHQQDADRGGLAQYGSDERSDERRDGQEGDSTGRSWWSPSD